MCCQLWGTKQAAFCLHAAYRLAGEVGVQASHINTGWEGAQGKAQARACEGEGEEDFKGW